MIFFFQSLPPFGSPLPLQHLQITLQLEVTTEEGQEYGTYFLMSQLVPQRTKDSSGTEKLKEHPFSHLKTM